MCTPLIFLDDLHTHDSTVETTGKLETQEEESKGETAAAFKSLFEAFRTCMSRVQRYNFQRTRSETRFVGLFARLPVGNEIIRRSPTNMK